MNAQMTLEAQHLQWEGVTLGSHQLCAQAPTLPGAGEQVTAVLGPQGPTRQCHLAQSQPLPYMSAWRVSLQK